MNTEQSTPPAVVLSTALLDRQERLYEWDGKTYTTQPATSCDQCIFYWRDGGIYDACVHPDKKLAEATCCVARRKEGTNIKWVLGASNFTEAAELAITVTTASPDRYDRLRADLWIPPRDSGMRPGADAHREIQSRGNKC